MIDFHSHITPCIDDGAANMEMALSMAKIAVEDGIDTVIATPHAATDDFTGIVARRDEKLETFRQALAENHIPLNVIPGLECFVSDKIFDKMLATPGAALGGGPDSSGRRTMLLELSPEMDLKFTQELLFRAKLKKINLVLAHPERYAGFTSYFESMLELLDMGLYLQFNAMSIYAPWYCFGFNRIVKQLILHAPDQILLGSDAHDTIHRPPKISFVKRRIVKWGGEEIWRKLTHDNAMRLLPQSQSV